MKTGLVLGIDCSTTASKAVAWDCHGAPAAEGRESLALLAPHSGWGEQDARDWWRATRNAVRDVARQVDPRRIEAICVTHQRESFVPVDRSGEPLRNAILWLDERSREQVAALDQLFGHAALHDLTGRPPSMTQSLPKILWLQEHEPRALRDAAYIVDVHAYLVHALSGRWITSVSSGDPMGIVNMRQGAWAAELITALGLRAEQFVPLAPPGSAIAVLSDAAAADLGLQAGTPIVAGTGDGQAASLGAGITGPGRGFINLGTAIASGAVTDHYVTDLAFRTCAGAIPGTFVLEAVLRGGTATVTWFMEHFAAPGLRDDPYLHYEIEAERLPPGADGLLLVPYWNTVMNPYWDPAATGIVVGWTAAHRRHHLYRAILDGIAFEQRLAMTGIAAASRTPMTDYVILGGGSRSALWCQVMADVLGAPVARARSADATNLGAAVLAAWAVGWFASAEDAARSMTGLTERFQPREVEAAAYERLFKEVYVGLFPALRPAIDRLTALTAKSAD